MWGNDPLDLPELWGISTASDKIPEIVEAYTEEVSFVTEIQQEQEKKLDTLTQKLEDSNVQRIKVDRLLSQLAVMTQGQSSHTSLKQRPLEFESEQMQTKLRQKVRAFEKRLEELKLKVIPLKIKASPSDLILENVEKCIFNMNEELMNHFTKIDNLSLALSGLTIDQDNRPVVVTPKYELSAVNFEGEIEKRWSLADHVGERHIKPTRVVIT